MKKYYLSLLSFLMLLGMPAYAASTGHPLDGKTFSGTVGEAGDKAGDPDNFEFANGKFHSTSCDQYGYTDSTYSATQSKNTTSFTSTTKNTSGDSITWQGAVEGDKITGTAVRKSASGKEYKMWFNGKLTKAG